MQEGNVNRRGGGKKPATKAGGKAATKRGKVAQPAQPAGVTKATATRSGRNVKTSKKLTSP